jgi:hypothetical protein
MNSIYSVDEKGIRSLIGTVRGPLVLAFDSLSVSTHAAALAATQFTATMEASKHFRRSLRMLAPSMKRIEDLRQQAKRKGHPGWRHLA